MSLPRVLAIPAAVVVILTVVGAWIDGSDSASVASVDGAAEVTTPVADDGGDAAAATSVVPPSSSLAPASTVTPTTTSCTSVVHIGDSTSVGLISEDFIEDPANRIDAQYRRVGVTDPRMEISGARSIVETVGDQLNAKEAAEAIKATGYEGCWVLAMGTTDTANVAVGSPTGLAERIDRMLSVIGDDPIMWVTVKTLDVDGAWSNTNMQTWNQTLTEAQARYPNIEVYDWAAVVQDDWFQDDNIHYTSVGYTERARLIADALVTAYPAS
ncbi:MAG: SGNH/GDSL hydrolase family protein [Ilumatobacteraceae bacterium]